MTNSEIGVTTNATKPTTVATGGIFLVFTWSFRLLLLLLGTGTAIGLGILAGHFYPGEPGELPLLEQAIRLSRPLRPKNAGTIFQAENLKVTLPVDGLFRDSQSVLRPESYAILDSIVSDLRQYQGYTIRVSAHTDNLGEARENQQLSLLQAQSIRQYLAQASGNKNRWVAIGYGDSAPLVGNTTDANRQRNRRIEIAILSE